MKPRRRRSRFSALRIGVLCLVASLVALSGAGLSWREQSEFRHGTERAVGSIVDLVESCGEKGCTYRPVVEYTALDRSYRVVGEVGRSSSAHWLGESVPVVYQVKSPASGRLDLFMETWFGVVFGMGWGIPFGVAGVWLVIVNLRKRAAAAATADAK